jgi:hypothetical protein
LGTVKGLVEDASEAEKLYDRLHPSAIGLHISPEELKGLKAVADGRIKEVPLSSYEMVYARKLSVFGEVQVPSPSLVVILRKASSENIPVFPLDMNDEDYSDVYTRNISGLSMVRTSLNLKRINKKKFKSKTPGEFTFEWDRAVNIKAYMKVEKEREKYMARSIKKGWSRYKPFLCIVELERMDGITSFLSG